MSAQALPLQPRPLSQAERVADTFLAPSKTFADIVRSTSWWLPFVLLVLVTIPYAWCIGQRVGYDTVAEHEIARNSFMQDRLASLKPEQRAAAIHRAAPSYMYSAYGTPVVMLIIVSLFTLLLWPTVNFGLGGSMTFGQMFALIWYAFLPKLLTFVIATVLLLADVGTDGFDFRNPAGTNLGYYLTGSPNWLKMAGSFLDVFGIWSIVLMILGISIVARKPKGQAAAVVLGWWVIGLLLATGATALFG
jgi:hypothetical protein